MKKLLILTYELFIFSFDAFFFWYGCFLIIITRHSGSDVGHWTTDVLQDLSDVTLAIEDTHGDDVKGGKHDDNDNNDDLDDLDLVNAERKHCF